MKSIKKILALILLALAALASASPIQAGETPQKEKLCGDYRTQVLDETAKMATHYGIPQNVLMGLIWVESGCNPQAVSDAGAIGLMQVMPREKGRGFSNRPSRASLFDIYANVAWGTYILYEMDARYCEKWHQFNSKYLSKSQLEYWQCALGAFYEGTGVYFTGRLGADGQSYSNMVLGAAKRIDLK